MPDNKQPETPPDPVELVVKAVPRQLWVAIGAVTAMLLVSWLFFNPPARNPADCGTCETLAGRIVEVLAAGTPKNLLTKAPNCPIIKPSNSRGVLPGGGSMACRLRVQLLGPFRVWGAGQTCAPG